MTQVLTQPPEGVPYQTIFNAATGETTYEPLSQEEIARGLAWQAEYAKVEYKDLRANEYPSVGDQLDLIYHEGIDAWKAKIQEVKNKYPKPAE